MLLKSFCLCLLLCSVLSLQNNQERRTPSKRLVDKKGRIQKSIRYPTDNIEGNFIIYDAPFLAYIWPKLKNGIHLNLRNSCWDDIVLMMKDLSQGRAWTFNIIDASGRLESGVKNGNRFWIGSKHLCTELNDNFESSHNIENATGLFDFRHEDYVKALQTENFNNGAVEAHVSMQDNLRKEIIKADNTPPFQVAFSSVELTLNISKASMYDSYKIVFGLCLPNSCTREDVVEFLGFAIMINENLKSETKLPRSVAITRARKFSNNHTFLSNAKSIVLVTIITILTLVVIFGTLLDYDIIPFLKPKTKSFDLVQPVRPIIEHTTLQRSIRDIKVLEKKDEHFNSSQNITFVLPRCFPDPKTCTGPVDMETVTINNINNSSNVRLVTVKKINKAENPAVTLDVVSSVNDGKDVGCRKCGRYKKQYPKNDEKVNGKKDDRSSNDYMPYENMSEERNESYKWTILKRCILSFSLKKTLPKVLSTEFKSKHLVSIHGLKVISLLWMILIHMCVILLYISDNNKRDNVPGLYSFIEVGTYAFDTMIFVSGLFTAFHYLSLRSQYTAGDLVNFNGYFGEFLQFVCFITNRSIRLFPAYTLSLLIAGVMANHHHSSDVIENPHPDYINCNRYMWRNLLYINTFFDKNQMCTQWSWYLTTDTQFHLIGVLMLTVTGMRMLYVTFLATGIMILSWINNSIHVYKMINQDSLYSNNPFEVYSTMTESPWIRMGPYFIGIFSGWLLNKVDCNISLSKVTSSIFWTLTVCLLTLLCTHFGGVDFGVYGVITYSTISHTLWSIGLLWISIACVTGHGGPLNKILSSKFLYPLSRLCFCTYLLHPILIQYVLFSANAVFHINGTLVLVYYIGFMVLSLLAGLWLSVTVEMPFSCTIRRFMAVEECSFQN